MGLAAVLAVALATPTLTLAHWVSPAAIVAQLNNDKTLSEHAGLREAHRSGRLLVIRVDSNVWAKLPPTQRRALAEAWHQLWRHSVDQGIVAVVSVSGDRPLVNYDAFGQARLLER